MGVISRIAGRRRTRTGPGTGTGKGPEADRPPRETFGTRWARLVTRRPVAVLLLGLLGLGALAVPAADLRLGLTSPGSQAEHTSARQAYDLVSDGFGPGFNGPLTVVVDASGAPKPKQAVARVTAEVGRMPGVAATLPPAYDARSGTAVVTALPKTGPDSARTKQLVSDLRDHRADWKETTGADVAVTGTTAAAIDVSQKLTDALPPFLAVIVGIAAVLLTLAFRSVLIPLKAIAGFLLSIAASTGVVVAVYQWGWLADFVGVPRTGPVVSFLPILLISVLFGLAMEYQLFLVSRMKEEYVHGAAPRDAVVRGFGHSARVVTAAALIMVSVFAGFVFDDDPIIQPIGFALAVGVLVDAFVVRMALVPAAMALAGRAAWWFPRSWERVVPRVDMEGEALATEPPVREPVGTGPCVKV
ncbi:MMPL family transporter [Streptomyces sp. LNU-CPARS28]|uniref:MMPL family transporter n=1 Tax=Streptomyces sp. LNU-CPARS28 TaxID=3137371 RepID=UPI00313575FF